MNVNISHVHTCATSHRRERQKETSKIKENVYLKGLQFFLSRKNYKSVCQLQISRKMILVIMDLFSTNIHISYT